MDHELANVLKNIQERLSKIEENISSKSTEKEAPNNIHLSIQEVNIQTFHLEELAYHLKELDVKELSGMINLGNTFSPVAGPKKETTKPKSKSKKNSSSDSSEKKQQSQASSVKEKSVNEKNKEGIEVIINGKKVVPKIIKSKGSGTD